MSANDHGSNSTYNNHHCRCTSCKAAHRKYHRRYRQRALGPERTQELYDPWLLNNFPLAIIARKAFPDDDVAIARCIADGSLS